MDLVSHLVRVSRAHGGGSQGTSSTGDREIKPDQNSKETHLSKYTRENTDQKKSKPVVPYKLQTGTADMVVDEEKSDSARRNPPTCTFTGTDCKPN